MADILMEPWRAALSVLVALIGASVVVAGVRAGPRRWRAEPGAPRAFAYLYTFRRVVVGLAVIAAAMGLAAHIPWLLAASVTIGIGEWLESSYYIAVLRWGRYARAGNERATSARASSRLASSPSAMA